MNTTTFNIVSFLVNVTRRNPYESLVFISSPSPELPFDIEDHNLIEEVGKATGIPVLSLTYISVINITNHFNAELFAIVDLQANLYSDILTNLALFLHLTTRTRVLLVLDLDTPNEDILEGIFRICWQRKLINVIAICRDFPVSQEFYGYAPYPSFHLEKQSSSSRVIYPNRVQDMKGVALKTFADQIAPLDMMARKPNGEIELFGYVGHIIAAFVGKHNATLDYTLPYEIGQSVYFGGIRDLLYNDTLDVVISMTLFNESTIFFSYPVEQTSYCMMLPVEKDIPTFKFYVIIMDGPVLGLTCCFCFIISVLLVTVSYHVDKRRKIKLIDVLLNDSCIRGLLSQSFNVLKSSSSTLMLIYLLLSLMGMYFTTWYLAYLQTYLTHPPTYPKVETYLDFHKADFKVMFYGKEFRRAHALILGLIDESRIKVVEDYGEYLNNMDSMNPDYSYFIQDSKWSLFKAQQDLFSKPLFRTSEICAMVGTQMAIPIHPNSVFEDTLNRVIMQTQDSGLLHFWMGRSYYELVQLGRMNFSDWSRSEGGFKQLQTKDLCWVFVVFVGAHCISCLVFVIEMIVGKNKQNV